MGRKKLSRIVQTINCRWCKNDYSYETIETKPLRQFCSRGCQVSFNNSQRKGNKRTKESIEKQKKSNKEFWKTEQGQQEKLNRSKRGKKFMTSNSKGAKKVLEALLESDKNHKKQKQTIAKKVADGEWHTWNSRNIRSYPELFVEDFLRRNNIFNDCIAEYKINKNDLGLNEHGCYFLDFYWKNKNINLEIDGSQHERWERKKSDQKRDKYLLKNNIKVVRIKWRNLKSKKETEKLFDELNNFLKLL